MAEPVYVLDADTLLPQAVIPSCPARVVGPFLDTDATYLSCAGVEGHEGQHHFRVEWSDDAK